MELRILILASKADRVIPNFIVSLLFGVAETVLFAFYVTYLFKNVLSAWNRDAMLDDVFHKSW